MARKRNYEKCEVFAKNYASGKGKAESLRLAGFSPLTHTADLLLADPKVQTMYQGFLMEIKSSISIDVDSILKNLVKIANNSQSDNARVNASRLLLDYLVFKNEGGIENKESQKIIFNISQVNSKEESLQNIEIVPNQEKPKDNPQLLETDENEEENQQIQ